MLGRFVAVYPIGCSRSDRPSAHSGTLGWPNPVGVGVWVTETLIAFGPLTDTDGVEKSQIPNRGGRPVVAGVDGSEASWPAVLTGAWEAQQRRTTLLLVCGYVDPVTYLFTATIPYSRRGYDPRNEANAMLVKTAERVIEQHPDLMVLTRLRSGSGGAALVEESTAASLVVVGARGSGGFTGLSIGSVGAQVAAHAHSPVIVVRPPFGEEAGGMGTIPRPGPIVVGVDGSSMTEAALAFAFEEASARQVPLVALYAWWMLPRDNLGPVHPGTYDDEEARTEAWRILAEAVAGWSPKYPDVPVEKRPVHTMNPSVALIEASAEAGLVVVGSRGRGGFTGLLLGSVGRDLVGHAHAPVAVIHDRI
jgi:nucleotide-binding universal stress UspA family protein